MMRGARRGQAALEFLTTYGWAMLIILVMVGAIAYFGILNPSKFLPDRCISSTEFNCEDHQIAGDAVSFQLKQGIGKTIYFESATCVYQTGESSLQQAAAANVGSPTGPVLSTGGSWSPRDAVAFRCSFPAGTLANLRGSKTKVLYNMTYKKSSTGFIHTIDGEIYSEVQ